MSHSILVQGKISLPPWSSEFDKMYNAKVAHEWLRYVPRKELSELCEQASASS